jgi:oligogalacturonide lyase
MRSLTWLLLTVTCFGSQTLAADAPPKQWIDPDTGHRIVRLSEEPGSESFYFNINAYTPDGKKMVFTSPTGIFAIDMATRDIEKIVEGQRLRVIMVGRKTGQVYYSQRTNIFAADPATKAARKIAELPFGFRASAVNCDETLLAGTNVIMDEKQAEDAQAREEAMQANSDSARKNRNRNLEQRYNDRLPMELFFYNIKAGELKKFNRCNDWLNHLLFSPTDPSLLMFCHEGPWHKVDRIWLIRSDGTEMENIHKRTMNMEIAGHEFWSADGRTAWYDLQTPRGEDFWVGGYNVTSGQRTWYHLERDQWSVHFNVSPDGKLFCGDGGSEGMVAHADNGKWIYLFHPELVRDDSGAAADQKGLIKPGVFRWERLVNMSKHDYALEPNANFTPDMKWIVFRSNMFGPSYVFAVEVAKAQK